MAEKWISICRFWEEGRWWQKCGHNSEGKLNLALTRFKRKNREITSRKMPFLGSEPMENLANNGQSTQECMKSVTPRAELLMTLCWQHRYLGVVAVMIVAWCKSEKPSCSLAPSPLSHFDCCGKSTTPMGLGETVGSCQTLKRQFLSLHSPRLTNIHEMQG